jgi:hypothetical protein
VLQSLAKDLQGHDRKHSLSLPSTADNWLPPVPGASADIGTRAQWCLTVAESLQSRGYVRPDRGFRNSMEKVRMRVGVCNLFSWFFPSFSFFFS